MLILEVNPLKPFSHAISILHRYDDTAILKSCPSMVSIIIPQIRPRCIVALQILPPFFTRFTSDQIHYVKFSIDDLFMTMLDMQRDGFSSLVLSLAERQPHITLEFQNPGLECPPSTVLLPLSLPTLVADFQCEDVGDADYSLFVSVDIEVFRHVVAKLNNAHLARVTITDSEIKFSTRGEVSLTTQREECIIGGVGVGVRFQSTLNLYPIEFYYNFTSERLWLFKATNFIGRGLVLIAPMGLYAHISSYFPERF